MRWSYLDWCLKSKSTSLNCLLHKQENIKSLRIVRKLLKFVQKLSPASCLPPSKYQREFSFETINILTISTLDQYLWDLQASNKYQNWNGKCQNISWDFGRIHNKKNHIKTDDNRSGRFYYMHRFCSTVLLWCKFKILLKCSLVYKSYIRYMVNI